MYFPKRKVNGAQLFRYAWMLAYVSASTFGDRPSLYFNECLKLSWRKMQSMDNFRLISHMVRPYRPRNRSEVDYVIPANQLKLPLVIFPAQ
jgi:hypothetical protein